MAHSVENYGSAIDFSFPSYPTSYLTSTPADTYGIDCRKLPVRSSHAALTVALQSAGALLVKFATVVPTPIPSPNCSFLLSRRPPTCCWRRET